MKKALAILLPSLLFFGVVAITLSLDTPSDTDRPIQTGDLIVLSSDDQGILIELTVADYQIETIDHKGELFQRVTIPDMIQIGNPGEPQVPVRGAVLGLPTSEGVQVEIVSTDYEVLTGLHLYPAPKLELTGNGLENSSPQEIIETFTLNQKQYATNAFYPGQPAELGDIGLMRDQAVSQVHFYPVQYNPVSKEVRLHRRILARVTWDVSAKTEPVSPHRASPAFETLFQKSLLNYTSLNRSTMTTASPTNSAGNEMFPPAATTNTLKIKVSEDGIYELTHADLTTAGFDLTDIDPRTIQINNRGLEVPIYIQGENDGTFNSSDVILFYGTAITNIYTIENVYWLTAGSSNGQRMSVKDGTPVGATVPTHFPVTLHAENDTHYWQSMPNGAGQDHWFWDNQFSAPEFRDYPVTLNNISTSATTATLQVQIKGRTDTGTAPDHHTRILLNSSEVDNQTWDGQIVFEHEVTNIPHSALNEGTNTIRVEGVGDTGATVDQFYLNWIELDYWDSYVAEADELLFGAPSAGTYQFEVTGFTAPQVELFEITDPTSVKLISNTNVTAGQLQFQDSAQPETRYLALTPAQRKSPISIEKKQVSSWKSPVHGADYIIITHEDFYTSSLTLAGHRSGSGFRVATVKVNDIYDEFNHGIFDPQAIRDFLSYTYHNWVAPAPTYVLLVGDAYQDYKDDLNTGTVNYVPAQIVETDLFGEVPSDNWFVLTNGNDILPDMFIGRLSAENSAQVDDIVANIINYEQNPPDNSWNKDVVLIADDDESIFEDASEDLAIHLPYYYTATKIYANDYPGAGDPTTDIINAVDKGALLVNYTGHGAADRWGNWSGGQIFNRSNINTLTNPNKLPVVTIANCLNGFFTGPSANASLAEVFQRQQNAGAVAVWAPSGLGFPSGHRVLMGEFYKAIFQDDFFSLGAATTVAKLNVYAQTSIWSELVETYVLFGDPALELGISPNYPYIENNLPINGASDVPIDQELQITFNKPMSVATVTLTDTTGFVFTPTWSTGNAVANFTHPDFVHGDTITVTIDGQDRLSNPLGPGFAPSTWSFTTTAHDVSPNGSIGVEGGSLTDVAINATLTISFTEPVRSESVSYVISPTLTSWLTWDNNGQVATVHHIAHFQKGQTYSLTVTAAKDVAGNPLLSPFDVAFTIERENRIYLPAILKSD